MKKKTIFHRQFYFFILLFISIQLHGCSSMPEYMSYSTPPKTESPAVRLMADAEQSLKAGKLDQAEMYIERALRVDPDNGELWHCMARIKNSLGNYHQAVQFCLKSNSLAKGNSTLIRRNRLLMEDAFAHTGKTP